MDNKEFDLIEWMIVIGLASWGGIVKYLTDIKTSNTRFSVIGAIGQVIISGFTGFIGGLIGLELGLTVRMTYILAGMSGAMGSIALTYFWNRITGAGNGNQ